MALPLYAGWRLQGDELPERLLDTPPDTPGFSLPGAEKLFAFSDLLGLEPEPQPEESSAECPGAPFSLPGMIPEDVPGEVTLSREIDFSTLQASRAFLSFDFLSGSGRITLSPCALRFPRPGMAEGSAPVLVAAFDNAPLTMDVTPALLAHRRYQLTLHIDKNRPAGVCGAVMLRTCTGAVLQSVQFIPHPLAGTMTLKATILPLKNGTFSLRAQLCPAKAPASPEEVFPIREVTLHLIAQQVHTLEMTMETPCARFIPGEAYAAPGIKIQLFEKKPSGSAGILCDSRVLMCGFPGDPPASTLPLSSADLLCPPQTLLERLTAMSIPAVSLDVPASDLFYRLMTRAGIAVRHSAKTPEDARGQLLCYPCVTLDEALPASDEAPDHALSAWQLCGLTTYARAYDPAMTPAECLREAIGRDINAKQYAETLSWLRAVSIRLRAEAIRQGKLSGPYCAKGEWNQPDIAQAIGTALVPLHLSALPLCGAWWTGARFSATLIAFIPKDILSVDKALRAEAVLEDENGAVIARTEFPCAPWRSNAGLMETVLPQESCVLELTTRLYADDEILEESVLPVYVGERGPLEAAF